MRRGLGRSKGAIQLGILLGLQIYLMRAAVLSRKPKVFRAMSDMDICLRYDDRFIPISYLLRLRLRRCVDGHEVSQSDRAAEISTGNEYHTPCGIKTQHCYCWKHLAL